MRAAHCHCRRPRSSSAASTFAQVGRGWSDWPTSYADAQRTSWLRTDPKISVESMSKPGFELQWTSKLDNQSRGLAGLTQGVTASGVTLFVPTSLVAGSSNNLYMLDNDTGYVIWSRTFEGTLPAATAACSGGITAAPTRIVSAAAAPTRSAVRRRRRWPSRNQQGYRALLGEPARVFRSSRAAPGRACRPGPPGPGRGAAVVHAGRRARATDSWGTERRRRRPGRAMVGYAVAANGQLHVVGLQSGKDLQRPAPFLPANAQWSNPVAVGTMMYAATSGNCASAPNGVYAIDLDAADKPVVSYRTNGGSVVGSVAFSSDGNTLLAAIGPGKVTGDGKANAIVALDPRTLQLKDWFTQPTAEFVTGPTVFRHGTRSRRCRHKGRTRDSARRPRLSAARTTRRRCWCRGPSFASGGSISAEALSTWARAAAAAATARGSEARWILVPVSGRPSALARPTVRSATAPSSPCAWPRPRVVVARARVDIERSDDASDADHCQRRGVRAVNRTADGGRWDADRRQCSMPTTACRARRSGTAASR